METPDLRIQTRIRRVLVGVLLCLYMIAVVLNWQWQKGFIELERREAIKNAARCAQSICNEYKHLESVCIDWATFDESWQFARGENPGFVTANFGESVFETRLFDLAVVLDTEGRVKYRNLGRTKSLPGADDSFPAGLWRPEDPILEQLGTSRSMAGLSIIGDQPVVVAAAHILKTNGDGPRTGTLIIAKWLDEEMLAKLIDQVVVDFSLLTSQQQAALQETKGVSKKPFALRSKDAPGKFLQAYHPIQSIAGGEYLWVDAQVPRVISTFGWRYTGILSFQAALVFLILMLLSHAVLGRIVVKPIRELTEHARRIAAVYGGPPSEEDHDEIARLRTEFENMLQRIGEREQRLNDQYQELKRANTEIQALQGLLPLCLGCRKVRDDGGYWQAVETYLAARGNMRFSHGYCPDCLEKEMEKIDTEIDYAALIHDKDSEEPPA